MVMQHLEGYPVKVIILWCHWNLVQVQVLSNAKLSIAQLQMEVMKPAIMYIICIPSTNRH
ncbi:hypothetical protein D3C87_1817690 [compost metagenome]